MKHALLLALLLAITPDVLTNQDVIALTKAGLSADVIIGKISASTPAFRLTVEDLVALKAAHVDDRVLAAMLHASTPTPAPERPVLPPVRFGKILIDLPGIRAYEGTLTISATGIAYEAAGFGTIEAPWSMVESVCFESAFYGSLFVRVRERWSGSSASKVGRVVLLKCAPSVMRPAFAYLKRMQPTITLDCTKKGKDV